MNLSQFWHIVCRAVPNVFVDEDLSTAGWSNIKKECLIVKLTKLTELALEWHTSGPEETRTLQEYLGMDDQRYADFLNWW